MKRLILAGLAAAGVAAAVSAREYNPGPAGASGRSVPREQAILETGVTGQLALEAIEKLTPNTDPAGSPVTFAIRSIDPSGNTLSQADDSALSDMAAWQVQILDRGGKKVGFIQGKGQPPSPMLFWSGLSRNGEPFPSGFYSARFVWTDHAKKVYATPAVSFNLFAPLKNPEFAELDLTFGFTEGLPFI